MSKIRFIIYQFTDETKYLNITKQLELKFSQITILKALRYKYCRNLGICHKYVVQFKDPAPEIYWYTKRAKLTFLNMPALNPIQQKQCSCLAVFETQCIIYRPDLHKSQASGEKLNNLLMVETKLSINVKTKNTFKRD